jgi:hypothetical protein
VIQSYEATTPEEDEEEDEEEGEEEDEGPAGGGGFGGGGGTPSLDAGSNRFQWNLRHPGYTDFEGRIFWAAGNQGPQALPGRYTVRLTVDGRTLEQEFEIKMNPRAAAEGVTLAELRERFDFSVQIRDRVTEANEAVIRIRRIKEQIAERREASDDQRLAALGGEVDGKLSGVEGEIYQVRNRSNQDPLNFPIKLNNKLAALMGVVEGAESRPTDQSYQVFDKLTTELEAELGRLRTILDQDVGRLNALLRELGMDPVELENLIT